MEFFSKKISEEFISSILIVLCAAVDLSASLSCLLLINGEPVITTLNNEEIIINSIIENININEDDNNYEIYLQNDLDIELSPQSKPMLGVDNTYVKYKKERPRVQTELHDKYWFVVKMYFKLFGRNYI